MFSSFTESTGIVLKTFPYLMVRMLVYLGAAMAFFVYWIFVFLSDRVLLTFMKMCG